jgi:hypothetical protein
MIDLDDVRIAACQPAGVVIFGLRLVCKLAHDGAGHGLGEALRE